MDNLVFESSEFRPFLSDDAQVNPDVCGFELAAWLSRKLAEAGFETSYPESEDWGWFIERIEDGGEYRICMSGSCADRTVCEWRIFVTGMKGLFRSKKPDARVEAITDIVRATLEKNGIIVRIEPGA